MDNADGIGATLPAPCCPASGHEPPARVITLSDAGELLGAVARGGQAAVEEMTRKLIEAVARAFPEGPPPPEGNAAPSTGRRSTRKPSKPASKAPAPSA